MQEHSRNADRAVDVTRFILILLGTITSIGQFATNIQLPSFIAIASDFDVDPSLVPLTLVVYLSTFAISQLLFGPVSDRHGRKPVLNGGLLAFIIGSALCALSPTIWLLLIGRGLEGVGAGAAMVVGRAVLRDLLSGAPFARAMALITALGALLPSVAPLVGGLLQTLAGWRASFWLVALVAGVGLAGLNRSLPETCDQTRSASGLAPFRLYSELMRSRRFVTWSIGAMAAMGGLFAFFSGSPAVFIGEMGISPAEYGLYPPIVASGFALGAMIVRRRASRVSAFKLAAFGALLMGLGTASIIAPLAAGHLSRIGILAGITVFVCGLGAYLTIAVSDALEAFPDRAGSASALIGFAQTAGAAIAGVLVALLQPHAGTLTFPLVMSGMSAVVAWSAFEIAREPLRDRAAGKLLQARD